MPLWKRDAAALRRIKRLATAGWIVFTEHALEEMRDERTDREEVAAALMNATSCRRSVRGGRWIVECEPLLLMVVVEVQADVIVVTVWGRT